MKVLWISNVLMNDISLDYCKKPANGLWMEPLLPYFRQDNDMDLHIVYFCKTSQKYQKRINGITYYIYPEISNKDKFRVEKYEKAFEEISPDVINIWGTERTRVLSLYNAAKKKNIPCVFFIQGLIHQIGKYCKADFSFKERVVNTTLRDIYRGELPAFEKKSFEKIAKNELAVLSSGINYLYENLWCHAHCACFNDWSTGYQMFLPVNNAFFENKKENYSTDGENISVFCNASGYALKGLHVAIKALAVLKKKYPKIKLFVPGKSVLVPTGSIKRQKYPGYYVYVSKLIKKYGLDENIVFLGTLPQEELAKKMAQSDLFIMSSCLENHSSSLKEAMALGLPCVTSYLSGVDEYVRHGENAFFYRFGDVEVLAFYIDKLISDRNLAEKIGRTARKDIAENDNIRLEAIFNQLKACYSDIFNRED